MGAAIEYQVGSRSGDVARGDLLEDAGGVCRKTSGRSSLFHLREGTCREPGGERGGKKEASQ